MRLTTVLLIASLVQVSAAGFAQKITLSKTNAPLKTVLKDLRQQSGFDFIATEALLEKSKSVNLKVKDMELEDVLENIFDEQPLTYTIENKTVTLKAKEPSFLDNIIARFTDIDVRGRVVDETGNPLPNASIQVKGKAKVYNSNDKGEFVIANVPDDAVLVIRYVGYKQLEISLKDAMMPLEVKLNVATGDLEEVNVTYSTGYQNIPKERATGSFVQLSNEDINRNVSTNVLDRILNITNSLKFDSRSMSRSTTNISIRGLSTINANQKPLIVVDGFPYEENGVGLLNENILNNLNPNDVESITILRDAAAASIWGARAANGVIVITTKKGKFNQKPSIQFTSSVNISERPNLLKVDIMSAADVIEYEKKLFASGIYNSFNGPFTPGYNYPAVSPAIEIMLAQKRGAITQSEAEAQLNQFANHDVRKDINTYLIQPSINQQYNLNISGGGDKMNYYGAIGYDQNLGTSVGDKNSRLTLNFKNTYRPIKKLELNTHIHYTQSTGKNNSINYMNYLADGTERAAPYTMLADEFGDPLHAVGGSGAYFRTAYIDTISAKGLLDWHYRPLDEINNNDKNSTLFNVRFGGEVKYTIVEGLNVNLSGQYFRSFTELSNHYSVDNYFTRNSINQFMFLNTLGQPQYPIPIGGILDYTNQKQNSYNLRAGLNFHRVWERNELTGIAGIEVSENTFNSHLNRLYGYDPLTLGYAANMDFKNGYSTRLSGTQVIPSGNLLNGSLNRFFSYYGNIGYTLLSKYTVTASGRIDASNFFGVKANLRSAPLWSTGVSWDVFKESFFSSNVFSSLKFRGTYGFSGNLDNSATALPTIGYRDATGAVSYNNSQQYAILVTPPNPGLTWEKVRMINLGVDFGMFNNRVIGYIEYYTKKTKNLISTVHADVTSGFESYTGNIGGMKGNGIDISLTGLIINRSFKLNTALSFSYNQEEITAYYWPGDITQASSYINSIVRVAKPLNYIYSYKWAGLNALNGDPMSMAGGQVIPFSGALNNNITKSEDLIYNGNARPTYFGNVVNTLSYKGVSASFNVIYKLGYYFRTPSVDYSTLQNNWGAHGDYAKRWQKSGDELITNIPSMPTVTDNRYSFYRNSEILVEKGDHIRLQDLRLAYNLNKIKMSKLPFNNVSLFVLANNIGIILWKANNKGIDPESVNVVSAMRSLAFGLTLNY